MLTNKYIRKFYLKYALFFIIGIVALVVIDIVQLRIPVYLGNIVSLLNERPSDLDAQIGKTILYTVIVSLIMLIGRITWRLTLFYASSKIEADIRHDMFLKAERLSLTYYHQNKVGTIMAWFTTDIETVEEYLGWGTIMIIDAGFLSVLTLVNMFTLCWQLALIAMIPVLLIVIWGALVEKFMSNLWKSRQESEDALYDFSQENFTGIRVIKAFVKENKEIHAFAKVARKSKDVNIHFVKVSVIFDIIIEILCTSISIIILTVGGYFVYKTITSGSASLFGTTFDLEAGMLVTFIGFFDTLIWPLIALGQIITMRSRSKASLKRITNFLNQEEDIFDKEDAIELVNCQGEIIFNNFSFTYPSTKKTKLHNINLTINKGERIGIVGKIGSGKSTLVNSLLRLYNIENNSILIDGKDIMSLKIDSLRDAISYVPQDNFLFSDKIKNNIAFYDENESFDNIIDAAKFSCIHEDIEEFNEKYDTVSGERGVTLSGGQKQRISIARAYIKNAPIMILDDSVSAVDVKTEETILKNIKELRKGKTTLVVASRVSTVSSLDKIIVLNEGKVEAFDTHENLLKTSKTYERMVYLQKLEQEVKGGK